MPPRGASPFIRPRRTLGQGALPACWCLLLVLAAGLAPAQSQEALAPSELEPWVTDKRLPWSKPVLDVPEQGDEGWAVFDRHGVDMSFGRLGAGKKADRLGMLSRWGRREVVIYGQRNVTRCVRILLTPICENLQPLFRVDALEVRVGNRVERLEGSDSRFRLSAPLAEALAQPSTPPPAMWVRLILGSGAETVSLPIGEATVSALQTISRLPLDSKNGPLPPGRQRPMPQPGSVAADPLPRQLANSLPRVAADHWRLGDGVPWSEPVVVRDRFEGDFVGVFDRDVQRAALLNREVGLVSLWGRAAIWLQAYVTKVELSYASLPIQQPTLQLGERSFALKGDNNRFAVDDGLAAALRTATPGTVSLSFTSKEGELLRYRIGDGTVKAWATVYQPVSAPASVPAQPKSQGR
ncbi:MAG: hypothetical protein ACK40D_00035 [Cyanobacteriota bacterium]